MKAAAFLLGLILGGIVTFAASWGYFRGYGNVGAGFFALVPIIIAFFGFYGSDAGWRW